jgi:hypothetical protein
MILICSHHLTTSKKTLKNNLNKEWKTTCRRPATSSTRERNPRSILTIAYILGAHVPVWLAAILIVDPIFLLSFNHRRTDNILHPHAKTCQTSIVHKLIIPMTRPNTCHRNNNFFSIKGALLLKRFKHYTQPLHN